MRTVLILLAVAGICVADFGLSKVSARENDKEFVYQMCQQSRIYDTVSEETCGDLLNKYDLYYMCVESNKDIKNKCRIEEI